MSSRTQTTEVLLRWKYVIVRRSLYTHKQFTISEAEIFQYEKNLWDFFHIKLAGTTIIPANKKVSNAIFLHDTIVANKPPSQTS